MTNIERLLFEHIFKNSISKSSELKQEIDLPIGIFDYTLFTSYVVFFQKNTIDNPAQAERARHECNKNNCELRSYGMSSIANPVHRNIALLSDLYCQRES